MIRRFGHTGSVTFNGATTVMTTDRTRPSRDGSGGGRSVSDDQGAFQRGHPLRLRPPSGHALR
jgi:hypothetical protein